MLLILDRMDDPVTPLLSQWTYQAMVHELLGLNRNRVTLKGTKKKELEEVVLSSTQDKFFADHRHANYGDLGGQNKLIERTSSLLLFVDFITTVYIPRYFFWREVAGGEI